jgi:hypothetical protein
MRFARHLGAALLAVAVIVALGVAWEHSPAASWLGAGPGRPTADHEPVHLRPAAALNLSNLMDLARTVVIEAAFIAMVVAIDVIRRRRRRARRSGTQPLTQ